jgi:hypothetical protein
MSLIDKNYACQYCGNKYSKEKTLAVHVCEQKRALYISLALYISCFDGFK